MYLYDIPFFFEMEYDIPVPSLGHQPQFLLRIESQSTVMFYKCINFSSFVQVSGCLSFC